MVHQGDNINADGQVNMTITEAPLFGLILSPLTQEDVERLQQYASELEGNTILDMSCAGSHHRGVFGLHSLTAKIADAIREILHSASLKASSLWRLTPFTQDVVKGDFGQAFQDDAHYSADDLRKNRFDNNAELPLFEQIISELIRSHIHHIYSEQIEEVAKVQAVDAPSGLEDTTHS
jgi:hypothetical protein